MNVKKGVVGLASLLNPIHALKAIWKFVKRSYYTSLHMTIHLLNTLLRRRDPYPKTVKECLDENLTYRKGTDEALIKFKDADPWDGTLRQKRDKIRVLNDDLAKIYKIKIPGLVFLKRENCPNGPCYYRHINTIFMEPTASDKSYSVVAFLHEFGHALGKNEHGTCRWSINLFKRHFPEEWAKLEPRGHLLFRKRTKKAPTTENPVDTTKAE